MIRVFVFRAAVCGVVALTVVGGVQAQTTTGRLIGSVVDEGGQGLPGVTVTIDSESLIGGNRVQITDTDGVFQFIGLAPGVYNVNAVLSGFVSQERNDVKVPLGGAASLFVAMPQGSFEDEIEVVSQTPVVDPTQVNTEQVFDYTYMQNSAIGSANRSYLTLLGQTPGSVPGAADNPKVFGSTFAENAYFIDGQDTTDPVTATWGVLYNYDALEEVEFQTSGFEAQYGRATGGLVNLITKSGGNQFSGTLDLRYNDTGFQDSGDHFDPDDRETSFQEYSATLGGPILRDKLWFFLGYQFTNSEQTPIDSPTTRDFEGQNYNAKLTWQAAPSWRLVGKYAGSPADIDNNNASQFVREEANAFQTQGTDLYTLEANGILSDSLMWNTVFGLYRSKLERFPMSRDLVTAGHVDLGTGIASVNFTGQQYSKRNRDDFVTDLTWFVEGAGSHELKGGIQYSGTDFESSNCSTGTTGGRCAADSYGYSYQNFFGGPFFQIQSQTAGQTSYDGTLWTGYIQDSWRVNRNLTLKIGLRYDQVSYDNDAQVQIAEMDKLQPRIGAAWDIKGDGKNLLRGNWGQFMHPNSMTLPDFAREAAEPTATWYSCQGVMRDVLGLPIASAADCEMWAGAFGFDYMAQGYDPNRDPYGWALSPLEITGNEPGQIAPGLRPTYAETWSLTYEREVGQRASVELTYINKKTEDLFEDTCGSNLPEFEGDTTTCNTYVLGNLPQLKRDYDAFILAYQTRTFSWLNLVASYTYSDSKGSLEDSQGNNTDFDYNPAHFDNRYGYLTDHRQHRFKLNGYFSIKGDWIIAFDSFYSSNFRWEPRANEIWSNGSWEGNDFPLIPYGVYFVEPRGNRQGSSAYRTDLQLSKGFKIGPTRLVLIGSALNVLSTEYVTGVCTAIQGCGLTFESGFPMPEFELGEATSWADPRRYEVGLRIEF